MNDRYPVEDLEKAIGWEFKNKDYIETAITHSSYMNERVMNVKEDYERQEFLGDAVLELMVSEFLFNTYKDMDEGRLTKMRSSMVCEPSLAVCAKELNLSEYIRVGKGDEMQGSRYRDSIVSDVFEAVIGALYLDGGMEAARDFIERFVLKDHEKKIAFTDSKSMLQDHVQKNGMTLEYALVGQKGPDHDRTYEMAVFINGKEAARGEGHTKKSAQQQAAYIAYEKIKDGK
ncbi:MAG: ribonuclease III [Lachnospiraceae bacterium]|nr:ribonuclease III [Lachnospiraceae bacterium]